MSRRKSAVSMFGNLANEDEKPVEGNDTLKPTKRARRVTPSVVSATERSMTDIREERDRLLAGLAEKRSILSLDASRIDPSPVADRMPDDDDAAFEALKSVLEAEGQKVPITVRVHPDDRDRYQIVYGHRRTRALRELGREVDALVVDYSDRDLLVAQGIENANRQDLTWIEKALFASRMSGAGLKARDIRAALGVDDGELSRFRAVTKALPVDVLEGIGRAPKAGRPRWRELAQGTSDEKAIDRAREALASDGVRDRPSDDRFAAVLDAVGSAPSPARPRRSKPERPLGDVGTMKLGPSDIRIALSAPHAERFKAFLEREMDDLLKRYERESLEE